MRIESHFEHSLTANMIFWRLSGLKANSENLCELLDAERANRHSKALEEPMGMFSISWLDS
jgi:hypothetical protein